MRRVGLGVAGLVALAGVLVSGLAPHPWFSGPSDAPVLAACFLPGVLLLGTLPRARRPLAGSLLAAGAAIGVVGILGLTGADAPDLSFATAGIWFFLTAVSAVMPLLAAAALLAGGAGLLTGRRWLPAVALALAALVTGWFALVRLAGPVARTDDKGFWLDRGALASAATLALVALALLALAAVSPWLANERPAAQAGLSASVPPVGRRRPSRRVRLVGGALVAVAAVAALAVAGWRTWGNRFVLADVFPDPALSACVGEEMGGLESSDSISAADLDQVLSLDCAGSRRITNLTGVGRLPNLATLDVSGNAVRDLAPLRGLRKLSRLTLTNNRVDDLSPLAGLPVLTDLGASGNAVADVRPLAEVPTLRHLGLAANRITDVRPLTSLTGLIDLDLSRNAIADLAPLAGLDQLDELQLSDNAVRNLGPLSSEAALRVLRVDGNEVTDVAGLAGSAHLAELWLGRNPVQDVRPLLGLPALTGVDLEGVPSAIPGVAELRARGVYVGGFAG